MKMTFDFFIDAESANFYYANPIHLHFHVGANTIRRAWPICGENRVFSMIRKQRVKTSRTGCRAIQPAGSAAENFAPAKPGLLGSALLFLFFPHIQILATQ
jgi:hypothetical protein